MDTAVESRRQRYIIDRKRGIELLMDMAVESRR